MDIVFINELHTEAVIGIYDFEKSDPQPLIFDIEMATDIEKAAQSDDIRDALNYAAVSEKVQALARDNRAELLEALIVQVADVIMTEFNVSGIKIRLHKPKAVADASSVGLYIERGVKF